MPRVPSATDAAVLDELANRGIRVSPYQLERWRTRGLVPRNDRRGLGQGLGTRSVTSADLVSSLETVAVARGRGIDVEWRVLAHMHRLAASFDENDRLAGLAERPIRRCLEYAVMHDRPASTGDDDAYDAAARIASREFEWWLPHTGRGRPAAQYGPSELEDMRAACQQLLAADRIGVTGVGSELLLESVIRLRWARTNAEAETLVEYLDLVLNRRRDHANLARYAPYDQLLRAATLAARIEAFARTFPDRLTDSRFSWLPHPRRSYSGWSALLMAMLMDSSLATAADSFVARHPENPTAERRRLWLEQHVVQLRARFPEGIPLEPKRARPVGLDEFLDLQTGKWR